MNIAKFEDIVEELKSKLKKDTDVVVVEEPECERKVNKTLVTVLAIVGAVALIGVAAYCLFKYLQPDYLEDYEEDFEDLDDEPEVED